MPMLPRASLTSSSLNGLTIASIFFILGLFYRETTHAARPAFAGRGNTTRVLFPTGVQFGLLVSAACLGAFSSRNARGRLEPEMHEIPRIYAAFILSAAFYAPAFQSISLLPFI